MSRAGLALERARSAWRASGRPRLNEDRKGRVTRRFGSGRSHGWGIAHRIESLSSRTFLVTQGSLYPALVRMKRRGWVRSEWRTTENNRRARYYELTAAGRRQLAVERDSWARASAAINTLLTARWALGER